ncbi:hypothetical protein [Clostridium formicaceticum]|uniref:Uncharacterized protein n=1 Tax=Clostridium formicaceticum TaxID=1497 RepID=A0AAC9RL24_9CLOT|nr:hypothetical protein [Clostridium formicaceticum]ARE87280.1 hypothetical protein CLFO_16790 [Clostridium formicaceticum]
MFFLAITDEIVFPDIKTMADGRTISYINLYQEDVKKESIIALIEGLDK